MPRVISVHEYELADRAAPAEFEAALRRAEERGLFRLPGLEAHFFVKGLRGVRRGRYAAIWIYASREAWEALWGPPDRPKPKHEYPQSWRIWEDEVLAPFVAGDPDRIAFTAYGTL